MPPLLNLLKCWNEHIWFGTEYSLVSLYDREGGGGRGVMESDGDTLKLREGREKGGGGNKKRKEEERE